MNHLSCISDEALFFGCQKLNGLSGGRTAKLDSHHSFAFRDIIRHGVITNLFQQGLQQTISAKTPGLDELCLALPFLVLRGRKSPFKQIGRWEAAVSILN